MNESTTSPRVWLMTGCSSGFGAALAAAVVARGHRDVATARNVNALGGPAEPFPDTFCALTLDATDATQVKRLVARRIESMSSKHPGDTVKAAEAIIAAVESDTPPLRLILGKYANDKTRKKLADAERERAAWEPFGARSDFSTRPQNV
ncbi:MAG: SDR family NAD(P)-dependent oxidoreductase [Verrucomicrobiales bacterium]